MKYPILVGIVNITEDSFSDGGKYLDAEKAIAHARRLKDDDADIVELSGASSNPNATPVPTEEQIRRISAVLDSVDTPVSIDASEVKVQQWALSRGVAFLNDIKGFPDASLYPELARSSAKLIVMHSMMPRDKAVKEPNTTGEVFDSIDRFFGARIAHLENAGIARERLIIDPGMGFFLSSAPEPSFAVIEELPELKKRFGLPVMVSVSRKSFVRGTLPAGSSEAAAKTLEVELRLAELGVDYIRTHDVGQLAKALQMLG